MEKHETTLKQSSSQRACVTLCNNVLCISMSWNYRSKTQSCHFEHNPSTTFDETCFVKNGSNLWAMATEAELSLLPLKPGDQLWRHLADGSLLDGC